MRCAAAVVVVACSGTAPVPTPPPAASQAWSVAPERWTTTLPIIDLIALDTTRAIAIVGDRTWDDHGIQRLESFGTGLASIDLSTGAVAESDDAVRDPARIYGLVRVPASGKVVAFGLADQHTAAWEVDPKTLALTPLAMPDPASAELVRVGVSFDDTKIALCVAGKTLVRDTATLAIVDTVTGKDEYCTWGFPGETALDRPGPNGQKLRRPGSFWRLYTADNREIGEIRSERIRWRGDGNGAIAVDRENLVWMPTAGPIRQLRLPTQHAGVRPIPGRKEVVAILGDHQVGFADPETAKLRTLERHPQGAITGIGFRGDTVITGADTLRVWRAGALVEAGPVLDAYRATIVTAGPTDPVLVKLNGISFSTWIPGSPPVLLEGLSTIDRAGETWMTDTPGENNWTIRMGPKDHLVPIFTPVFRYKPAWTDVIELDAARGQILMLRDDTYYVITPATKSALPIALPCENKYLAMRLAHFAPVIVGANEHGVFRIDQTTGRVIDSIAEPGPDKLVAWVSADEVAFTEERSRGGRIILWSAGKTIVVTPKRRAPVTALAVDRDHQLLAIGHGDGSFEVEPLSELRARAKARDVRPLPATASCSKPKPFEELIDDGKEPD